MEAVVQTDRVEHISVGIQIIGLGVISPIEASELLDWLDMNDTVSEANSKFKIKNLEESLKFPESSYTLGVVISNEDDGRPEDKSFDNIVPVEPVLESFDNIVPVEPVLESSDKIVPVEPAFKSLDYMSLMDSTDCIHDCQVVGSESVYSVLDALKFLKDRPISIYEKLQEMVEHMKRMDKNTGNERPDKEEYFRKITSSPPRTRSRGSLPDIPNV